MKFSFALLLLVALSWGCQSSLRLTPVSPAADYDWANDHCRGGESEIFLRGGTVIKAKRVGFAADSVWWRTMDDAQGGTVIGDVKSVRNKDRTRGAKQGAWRGLAAAVTVGTAAIAIGAANTHSSEPGPFVVAGLMLLVLGPASGAMDGAAHGSPTNILIDSAASFSK